MLKMGELNKVSGDVTKITVQLIGLKSALKLAGLDDEIDKVSKAIGLMNEVSDRLDNLIIIAKEE